VFHLGWVDNLNGPMGMLLASCIGIIKTIHVDPDNRPDTIPVDVCSRALVIAAWKGVTKPR
jgi:alcohol-forming fatty acyl-CoA reductase